MPDTDRSIGAVLTDIVGDLQQIVRAEVRLAKAEIRDELAKAKHGASYVLAGSVLIMFAIGLLLLAAVYALAMVWPAWAAALAVGLGVLAIGAMFASIGRNHIGSVKLKPQKTVATVKENLQWAKTRAK